jgi:SNF2 family DNA or RNA helicase
MIEKMNEDAALLFKGWGRSADTICMNLSQGTQLVSAVEVVRIEFKGQESANGIPVNIRPSEQLTALKFNRFPYELKIGLQMPSMPLQRPHLAYFISSGNHCYSVQEIPEADQIIIEEKEWIPLIPDNILEVKELLAQVSISKNGIITLRQALELMRTESPLISISSSPEEMTETEISCNDVEQQLSLLAEHGFQATLYPYQKTGVSWLNSISSEGLGCILADEMGLGKTLQVIAVLTLYKIKWQQPALIIAPATLLENWRREFARFSPRITVAVHSGQNRTGFPSQLKQYDIVVCSYDTAARDQGLFGMIDWGFVVLDEAQAIKNPETRRAVATKELKRKVSIAVTGTPVQNRLTDLWSIMDFSCSGILGTREAFESNYEDDQQSAEKLEMIVSPLMLRRRVADVAADLPEKIIIAQPVNMNVRETGEYENIRQRVADEYGKSATIVSLLRLRQFCSHPSLVTPDTEKLNHDLLESSKLLRLMEILEEIVLNREKAIIFTSFTAMSDLLCADISKRFGIQSWQIDGRTPVDTRQSVVDQFSEFIGAAVLVLNPRAAGTGLNITAANHVIHYTLEWNPAVEDQATARAFRRGQLLPVTVHRLFYPGTVEEVINDRLDRKRLLAETAVVGTEAAEIEADDIVRALSISPSQSPEGRW